MKRITITLHLILLSLFFCNAVHAQALIKKGKSEIKNETTTSKTKLKLPSWKL